MVNATFKKPMAPVSLEFHQDVKKKIGNVLDFSALTYVCVNLAQLIICVIANQGYVNQYKREDDRIIG